jgi:hypothetical protein
MTKFSITNKTGMRLRYLDIKFEPNETKILDLDSTHEHEYFNIEKLEYNTQKSSKSKKSQKTEKEVNKHGISRRMARNSTNINSET